MTNNILWTGGWDSTFRILDLVLNKNQIVQPYYIVDYRRKSTHMELQTMEKIKKMISKIDPSLENRILSTKKIYFENIPNNTEITTAYEHLFSISYLGGQYDWLARCVKAFEINELELCIHKEDKAESFIKNDVRKINTGNDSYYILKENLSIPELSIFSYYRYPLLDITKLRMEEISKESGFNHLMEETWFCFEPTKSNEPCGLCNPCRYTQEEGLGRRVPTPSVYRKSKHQLKRLIGRVINKVKLIFNK